MMKSHTCTPIAASSPICTSTSITVLSGSITVTPEAAWKFAGLARTKVAQEMGVIAEDTFAGSPFGATQPDVAAGLRVLGGWAARNRGGLSDEEFDAVQADATRLFLGPGRVLSLSAIRPAPFAIPLAPNFVWSPAYYARVAAAADQIVIMAYDTALPTSALYRRYVAWSTSSVTARRYRAHWFPIRRSTGLGSPGVTAQG